MEGGEVKRIITLLTDFGNSCFVGIMKGVILSINREATIVDLTHEIEAGNVVEASFVLKKSYRFFPSGTIFVCVVDPQVGTSRRILILYKIKQDYIFLAPDNGLLSCIFEEGDKIYYINNSSYYLKPTSSTFHGRDIFAPISAFLSLGLPIISVAKSIDRKEIVDITIPEVSVGKDYIEGVALFADSFGNIITNIEKSMLMGKDVKKITFGDIEVSGIHPNFESAKGKGLSAIIGSFDVLEIFIYLDSVAENFPDWKLRKIRIYFS